MDTVHKSIMFQYFYILGYLGHKWMTLIENCFHLNGVGTNTFQKSKRGIARPTFTHATLQCRPPPLPIKCHFGVENNFLELAVDKKYKGCSGFVLARVVCLTRIRTKPPYSRS